MSVKRPAGPLSVDDVLGGRYRLLELVGAGGMGTVWRAYDEVLQREVAVKVIPAGGPLSTDEPMLEARAAARLDHPNVVRVYDVMREAGRSAIVMEYVDGRSLHEVVQQDGRLSHPAAARVGIGVLNALRAAHSAGFVHHDVKPRNVLLTPAGRVLLTDFGLAAPIPDGPAPSGTGEVLGSPLFVAPERLGGDDSGPPGDLWSLGATLYAAVEGRAPFERDTVADSLTAVVSAPPDPAAHPGPLHPVIAGLLVKDPSRRVRALDTYLALREVADRSLGVAAVPGPRVPPPGGGTSAVIAAALAAGGRPSAARRRRLRPVLIGTVAAAAATALGVAASVAGHHQPAPAKRADAPSAAAVITTICTPSAGSGLTSGTGPVTLPAGWVWHRDPLGFRIPLPAGWTRTAPDTVVQFCAPDGQSSFTVDTEAPLTRLPLQYWQSVEKAELAAGVLPGYRRVNMDVMLLRRGGADWQYTWQPERGPRRHVRRLLLATSSTHAYVLQWRAPEAGWPAVTAQQKVMINGFG